MDRQLAIVLWFFCMPGMFPPGAGKNLLASEDRGPGGKTSAKAGTSLVDLLLNEQWDKAAEVYGGEYYDLEMAVRSAWEWASEKKTDAARYRFRYHLVHFYYGHVGPRLMRDDHGLFGEFAAIYFDLEAQVPASGRRPPLGFSPGGLVEWATTPSSKAWDDGVTPEDESRILIALRASPESIPALQALASCGRRKRACETRERLIEAAEEMLITPLSRLWLARIVASWRVSGGGTEAMGRILESGWELAPTEGERAALYRESVRSAALLLEEATGERSVDARVSAERNVWMRFPASRAAAYAREEAVSLLAWDGRLREALDLVRRLQGMGKNHKNGLDDALWRLARGYEREGDRKASDDVYRELAEDFPETFAGKCGKLRMAQLAVEQGDDETALQTLEILIPGETWGFDALSLLAGIYERRGRWADAHRTWESFEQGQGTGIEDHTLDRIHALARCQSRVGTPGDVVRTYLKEFDHPHPTRFCNCEEIALTLFRLYERAGQIRDLETLIESAEKERLGRILSDDDFLAGWPPEPEGRARLGTLRSVLESHGSAKLGNGEGRRPADIERRTDPLDGIAMRPGSLPTELRGP